MKRELASAGFGKRLRDGKAEAGHSGDTRRDFGDIA